MSYSLKAVIEKMKPLKKHIHDKYAWPGGYPLYAVMDDGAALCVDCCKTEPVHIKDERDGWRIEGIDINYEDSDLYCAHCSKKIEAAYE